MPALTRQVSRSNSRRIRRRPNPKQFRGSSAKIPQAIRTRGTPDGYYEIPVRTLIKVVGNNQAGFFNTNQDTSSPSGIGFQGFGLFSSLDNVTMLLGEGSISASIVRTVPGFSEMARVFDQCKIAAMSIDVWFEVVPNSIGESTGTNYGMPDLYVTQDKDDAIPPANVAEILQYQKVQRMPGMGYKTYKNRCNPYVRDVNGTSGDETSTTTTISGSSPSGYMNTSKPAAAHLGWKGFMATDFAGSSSGAKPFVMNVLIHQIRRYKMSK